MSKGFIFVPISKKDGSELEPIRLNMDDINDYRKWKNKTGKEQTVFFFKKHLKKSKLIGDISVHEVDKFTGVHNVSLEEGTENDNNEE